MTTRRRPLLVSISLWLAGCLGFGTDGSETPTPNANSTPDSPTPTERQTAPPTPRKTPAPTATPTPSLEFEPDGPVIDVGEAVTIGAREFETTDWILKREIRYFDGVSGTNSVVTPRGSNTRWFQVSGRVTNTGESLLPTPSLDRFRVRHPGGRAVSIYRIDEVGGWENLREAGLADSIREPGLDRKTTYLPPDQTVTFDALFVVESGPELYLEWDTPGQHPPVYVQIPTDG